MIHTVKINDETHSGKRDLTKPHKYRRAVEIENSTVNDVPPEGYMTGEEFFSGIKKELKKRCQDNGLL